MTPLLKSPIRALFVVLMVPIFLISCGLTVWGAQTGIPSFSQTHARYLELCRDPSAGRDQWLEVIRSFHALRQNGSALTRTKSLFLAGKASLTLYGREGRVEDLDNAIQYFNEVKRITRHKTRLPAILRELRSAHRMRRNHVTDLGRRRHALTRLPAAPINHHDLSTTTEHENPQWGFQAKARQSRVRRDNLVGQASRLSMTGKMPVPPRPGRARRSGIPMQSPATRKSPEGDFPTDGKKKTAKPLNTTLRISGITIERPNSVTLSDTRNTSHTTRLSDVYQGNPFCPVRRTVPSYTPPRVETVSLPRSIKPVHAPVPPRCREQNRPFIVVIDPGHGGKDPGAVSSDGNLKEKDVALYVSRRLKTRLEDKIPGIQVELTRTDDRFLTVTQRTSAANSLNGDLFISIHCNSYPDTTAQGIETYYLSKAGSDRAMRVAARENDIPISKMSDVEATLLDLMMTSKKSESEKLAEAVHEALARITSGKRSAGRDRGVKRGPFYVLLGATMPAILVECGYISNLGDRRKLGDKRYLDSVARWIASGAHTYLKGLGSARLK